MIGTETELTPTQQELLDLLWATETVAPVTKRLADPDGNYRFEKYERPTRPIDFAGEGEFVLKSHEKKPDDPLSPFYINLRNLPSPVLIKVAGVIAEATQTQRVQADFCTGIPDAGEPIARAFSEVAGIHYRKLFIKATSDSGRRIIASDEVFRGRSGKLLIIDDLITAADTKWETINRAQFLNYSIAGIAVLVDRQQGGRDQLESKGYRLFAPLPISRVFAYYYQKDMIDEAIYVSCMKYLNDARASLSLPKLEIITSC